MYNAKVVESHFEETLLLSHVVCRLEVYSKFPSILVTTAKKWII